MTGPASGRPWWASDADDVDPGEDPLARHQAARRGGPSGGSDPAWSDALHGLAAAVDRLADAVGGLAANAGEGEPDAADLGHPSTACEVCPICVAVRAVADTRPELLAHLAEASRHVASAVRTLAAAPGGEDPDPGPLQRIDLGGASEPTPSPHSDRS